MLDKDLAELYGYEVKRLNEQVKRNKERFPPDFMFQLNENETKHLWSQNATANKSTMSRSLPYAFTEQGIYMLSSILKSETAIKQSIYIMRAFREMRHYFLENQGSLIQQNTLNSLVKKTLEIDLKVSHLEDHVNTIDTSLENVMSSFIKKKNIKEFVFLNNKQFEADEAYIQIYKQASHSIHIIDNYISIKTLSHIKHKNENVSVTIFSDNLSGKDKLRKPEFEDFNKQYPFLKIIQNKHCHDRFIIIDCSYPNEKIYHCGASSKDAGHKICSILEMKSSAIVHEIIDILSKNEELTL